MKKNPARNSNLKKGVSKLLEKINNSIEIDKRLYDEDIYASIAHCKMLMKTKIIIAPSTGQTITGQSIGSNVFYSHIDLIDIVNELEKGSNNG